MGLNSGEVVVGRIGDDLRMDYTAQGHTVALAQRMEALAEDGKPCLAAATAKLVEGFFELEDQGEFEVKGARKPVRVFALLDLGSARTRIDRPTRAGLSSFVGRDDELVSLMAALREAEAGRGQVVGIVAGPGLGKSRLAREFVNRVRAAGAYAVEVHCPSHGKQVPLSTYLDLARNTFRIGERDDQATTGAKIKERFTNAYPELIELMPLLCDFLGAPDPEQPLPPMTPEQRQKRLLEWQQRALKARDRRQECVVYLFEDMHWVDPASEELIDSLVQITPSLRHLVLMTYRPEYTPPWSSHSFYRQIPLLPLTDSAMGDLLEGLLGPGLAGSDLARLIRERCDGTPFFVEEMIQSLAESGFLDGERGAYTLAKPIDQIPLPGTVQAVLAARIDRLPEREKQVLQTASVIGRVFPRDVLEAVTDSAGVERTLRSLMDAELVYEESVYPELEYSFKHALVQDVAYESQLKGRREELHRRVADALERHYAHQLDATAALIARHHEKAGDDGPAARWHRRAAEWAGVMDWRASLRHWERVRDLTRDRDGEAVSLCITACARVLALYWREGVASDSGSRAFEEGVALAGKAEDLGALAILHASYSAIRGLNFGNAHEYAEFSQEAARIADRTGDPDLRCGVRAYLIWAQYLSGSVDECATVCDEIISLAQGDVAVGSEMCGFSPLLSARFLRGMAQAFSNDPNAILDEAGELEELAVRHHFPEMVSWFAMNEGILGTVLGESRDLERRAREALRIAEHQNTHTQSVAQHAWSSALAVSGRWEELLRVCSEGLREIERTNSTRWFELQGIYYLSWAQLELGQHRAARASASRAVALMEEREFYYVPRPYAVLARAQMALDEPAEAIGATLDEYAAVLTQRRLRLFEPELHELHARLASSVGEQDRAAAELEHACRLYRQVGATRHAERLARELEA
jgi:adenylate cyclase